MYHSIENANLAEDKMGLAVAPETFYMHMKYLKKNEFTIIALLELADRINNQLLLDEKSVVITFDDGYRSILTNALPILKEFGFSAALFVNIYFIERKWPKRLYCHDWETLSWDEVRKLYEEGMLIGSHAVSHKKLTEFNVKELKREIIASKELIEKNIQGKINTFSYPHGSFNEKVIEILKKSNYTCACSSIEGTNDSQSNLFALKRTEITSFDNTQYKFEKKMSGNYDWLRFVKSND